MKLHKKVWKKVWKRKTKKADYKNRLKNIITSCKSQLALGKHCFLNGISEPKQISKKRESL